MDGTEFIIPSLFEPQITNITGDLKALRRLRLRVRLDLLGAGTEESDLLSSLAAQEESFRKLPESIFSARHGYFYDPHSEYSMLSICGIVQPGWYNCKKIPKRPKTLVGNWLMPDLRAPMDLVERHVNNGRMAYYRAETFDRELALAQADMQENFRCFTNYWRYVGGEVPSEERAAALIEFFGKRYSALRGLLHMAVNRKEDLIVNIAPT